MSDEEQIKEKCDTGNYIELVCGVLFAFLLTFLTSKATLSNSRISKYLTTTTYSRINYFILLNVLILGCTGTILVYIYTTKNPTFISNRNNDDCNFLWWNKLFWILVGTFFGHIVFVVIQFVLQHLAEVSRRESDRDEYDTWTKDTSQPGSTTVGGRRRRRKYK